LDSSPVQVAPLVRSVTETKHVSVSPRPQRAVFHRYARDIEVYALREATAWT
jgi:uncharacterized protein YdhG (YjbR/CyaY superfamily)